MYSHSVLGTSQRCDGTGVTRHSVGEGLGTSAAFSSQFCLMYSFTASFQYYRIYTDHGKDYALQETQGPTFLWTLSITETYESEEKSK